MSKVIYHEGDYQPPTGTSQYENWTDLQAVLRWSIKSTTPARVSLSKFANADPGSTALTLAINVRQTWSARPSMPLTICTSRSVISDPEVRVIMRSRDRQNWLLGDPLPGVHMRYAIADDKKDWKAIYPFKTIPAGDDGITVTTDVSWKRLLQYRGNTPSEDKRPRAGEKYDLFLNGGRRDTFTDWWNWGDLEGDLKDRKLVDMVDPRLNGIVNPEPPPEPICLPYGSWSDFEDNDGYTFVRLAIHLDTTPVVVEFEK